MGYVNGITLQYNFTFTNFQCYSVDDLLEIFNLTEEVAQGLSQQQFENLCPALLQQVCKSRS